MPDGLSQWLDTLKSQSEAEFQALIKKHALYVQPKFQ